MIAHSSVSLTTTRVDLFMRTTHHAQLVIENVSDHGFETHATDICFSIPAFIPQTSVERLRLLGDLQGVSMSDIQSWTLYDFYHIKKTDS